MQHTIIALVENEPGVLTRVAGLFRKRAFNIDSLTVAKTENPEISRMTIVVDSNRADASRVMLYLDKLINVIEVTELSQTPMVSRDLAIIKVRTENGDLNQVIQLVDIYRARIVDVSNDTLITEITGTKDKIDSFIDVLRPIGIVEMARTGAVAMSRGKTSESEEEYYQHPALRRHMEKTEAVLVPA